MSPLPVRFMDKVGVGANGCWDWIGSLTKAGYGHLRQGGRGEPVIYAHRYSHEIFSGPIPEGMQIDHLCRNRRCVNPAHLEIVTNKENGRRGREARAAAASLDRARPQ